MNVSELSKHCKLKFGKSTIHGHNGKDLFCGGYILEKSGITLSFSNGVFELRSGNSIRLIKSYKAAAGLRQYADPKAERVLQRLFVKHYPAPTSPLPSFLDAHQHDGVRWILTRSRSYLAHAPGAGKTIEALVASWLTKTDGQTLFIVPPSLTANWAREVHHFWDLLAPDSHVWPSVGVIPETRHASFTAWGAEFIICPDSMLTREWVLSRLESMPKRFVAVDEASRFKDPKAERTKALFGGQLKGGRRAKGLVYTARHSVLLDGSPLLNRPMELWAPTYAMCPEAIDWMDENAYGFKFCGATINERGNWEFKHSSNETELHNRLTRDFMHVVPESALSHPERRRSILVMTVDARSPEARAWERRNLARLSLTDIDEKLAGQGEIARFRRELGVRKAAWVAEYIHDRISTKGESILLFAWHREVVDALAAKLAKHNPGVVYGGTAEANREQVFTEFQAGTRKLIIGNIAAMGRGHNLQQADRVVFAEFSWTDELNKQCEKRASRKGSDKLFVRCDYIVSPNSMDETILQAVFRKADTVRKVIG